MIRLIAIVVLLLGLTSDAESQLFGIFKANTGGGAALPGGCSGTLDLSKGCPQPMLGVM